MPVDTTEILEKKEQQQLANQINDTTAPLTVPALRSNGKVDMTMASALSDLSTATTTQTSEADSQQTTKRTEYTALTGEPVDNTPTSKWKNCQCNLQSDQRLSENPKQEQQQQQQQKNLPTHQDYEQLFHHQPPSTCKQQTGKQHSLSSSGSPPPPTNVITSLTTVYICLGILTLALASLSVLFYSHVVSCSTSTTCQNASSPPHNDNFNPMGSMSSSAPLEGEKIPKAFSSSSTSLPSSSLSSAEPPLSLFREQFQQELLASEHVLRSLVEKILLQPLTENGEHLRQQLLQQGKYPSLGNSNDQR